MCNFGVFISESGHVYKVEGFDSLADALEYAAEKDRFEVHAYAYQVNTGESFERVPLGGQWELNPVGRDIMRDGKPKGWIERVPTGEFYFGGDIPNYVYDAAYRWLVSVAGWTPAFPRED